MKLLQQVQNTYSFEDLVESEFIKEDGGNSVERVDGVDDDHEDKPEPHGEVHLLVDNVLDAVGG